ncbi:MAG: hypothetical protein ACSLFK_05850 [Gemmatimonadaceae bacterium]
MSRTPHGLALSVIIIMAFSAGCTGETTAADASDALAIDSMLTRQVEIANQEADLEIAEPEYLPPVIDSAALGLATVPAPAARTQPAQSPRTAGPPQRISVPPVTPGSSLSESRPRSVLPQPAPARNVERTANARVSRIATVPAGTPLVLAAGRRICVNTSRVGDTFNARVARSIPGPLGTVIPQGARVTAEVTALTGSMGEERLMIGLKSATVGGRTYQLSTQVTDFELDRKPGAYRCIPAGGSITAELLRPLRVTM